MKTRTYRGTARNLAYLARQLRSGELVGVPTETVYGLAANVFDTRACAQIFRVKGRPTTDPLIVHVPSQSELDRVCEVNAAALRLAERFWPGPLTLVLPKKPSVPEIVTAGRSSVAVRMPSHPLFRRLLAIAKVPLAAPSANPFGYISPTTAEHVRDNLKGKIRHILDGGPSRVGLESTIVDLRDPESPRLLRAGTISHRELEKALRRPVHVVQRSKARGSQVAPGMLVRHYSPHTPVVLHQKIAATDEKRHAFVFVRKPSGKTRHNVFWLDRRGDLRGAARRLFALLRELDDKRFAAIHIELAPGEDGFAAAINDRLRRAAAR